MAKKAGIQSQYRELLQEVKKKNFSNVYLLMGTEAFFLDSLVEALENSVIDKADRDFNMLTLYGADTTPEEVVNSAREYPFMAERRLVMLKEAQAMDRAKTALEKIAPYAANPSATSVLVIVYKNDPLGERFELVKAVKKGGGTVFVSNRLRDYEAVPIVKSYLTSKQINIADSTLELLLEYVGTDLSKLFGEIDKLMVTLSGDSKIITPELVEKNIGLSKDFNNFELIDAISEKKYRKCMLIVDYFKRNKAPVVMSISAIFEHFSKLTICHFSSDKTISGLMKATGVKSEYMMRKTMGALASYNARQCVNIIGYIREADCKSKGIESNQDEYEILRELIFNIFTAK